MFWPMSSTRPRCKSPKCPGRPAPGERFCDEHRAIFDRVRESLRGNRKGKSIKGRRSDRTQVIR